MLLEESTRTGDPNKSSEGVVEIKSGAYPVSQAFDRNKKFSSLFIMLSVLNLPEVLNKQHRKFCSEFKMVDKK